MKYAASLLSLLLVVCLIINQSVSADDLGPTEILLKGAPYCASPNTTTIAPQQDLILPYREGGELLKCAPAVTGSRMGGHGFEPVIRGQQQNQINVTSDGAFAFGGCPNRMDPPSSLLNVNHGETKVGVTRGYQSVLQGPGASGGAVTIENLPPLYKAEQNFRLLASSGYDSNGDLWKEAANLGWVSEHAYFRAGGFYSDADNYQDGSGDEVRSAFTNYGGKADFGWEPNSDTSFGLGWERNRTVDALFAGAGMDSPETQADIFTGRASHDFGSTAALRKISLNAYSSNVDHLMDNYSLRPKSSGFARAPSESDTRGGRLLFDLEAKQQPIKFGFDLMHSNRDARRFSNMSDSSKVSNLQSVLWPDVTIQNWGIFAESPLELAPSTTLKIGARYDSVDVSAGAADLRTAGMPTGITPNELYQRYYGSSAEYEREDNLGGLVKLENKLSEQLTLFLGVARAIRSADATERALASEMGSETWVGNPELNPEAHNIVDIGLEITRQELSASLLGYYDKVDDYILRDRARGQNGILQSDGANIYRNIDASLAGVEGQIRYNLATNWELKSNFAYTYGQDEDRDKALPQIPPLFGSADLSYKAEHWSIGTATRFANRAVRVDTDKSSGTGRDVRKTPGYGLLDIYGTLEIFQDFELRVGVSNLLNKFYANHLNRSNSFNPEEFQVNEPGRSIFAQIYYKSGPSKAQTKNINTMP